MKPPGINEIIIQDIDSLKNCGHKLQCGSCPEEYCVKVVSVADFPSDYGFLKIIGFVNNKDNKDHIIVLKGEIGDGTAVLTRIHSSCLTGDALGSRRCDCGPQLKTAMEMINREGRGIVLYHMEEGRGIGLVNKLRAYALQDAGLDTLDANTILGFEPDQRDYRIPSEMLKKIGVRSVRLMTNNPDKVSDLERNGIAVIERVHHEIPPQQYNRQYMETKKSRVGHLLNLDQTSKGRY